MPANLKANARAAVVAGVMTLEPSPCDLLKLRVAPVRRTVDKTAPPLDLTVLVFRYRQTPAGHEPIKPRHRLACSAHRS